MRKFFALVFVLFCASITAQNYGPPFPPGTFYHNGPIVGQNGFGVVGCPPGQYIKGDATGCGPGGGNPAVVSVAPSGDTTGGTDCAAIQTQCNLGNNVQLFNGIYYVGKSNTACVISHVCNIFGTSQGLTFIQNEGTTNDVLVVNTPNLTGSDLPPYTNPLPVGGSIGGFTIREDPLLTATAGAGLRVGTNGSNTTANYVFSNINFQSTYRGIQVDPGFWNNHFTTMVLWNMASTDCIFYDSPAPNGDNVFQNMLLVGSSNAHLCNINWQRADTGRANLIKFNNGKMVFGTANQSNIFASDVSIEGPLDCALDFSAGTSANYGVYNFSNFEFEVGTTGETPNPVCSPINAPGLNIRSMCLGAQAGSAGKCFNGPSYGPNWVPLLLQSYDSFGGGNNVPFVPSATNYIQGWAQMNTTAWAGPIYFNGNNQVGNSASLSHISAYYVAFTPLTLAHTASVYIGLDTSGGGWGIIGVNSSSQSASGFNGYGCRFTQGVGTLLERWDAGTNTQLGTTETSVTGGFHQVSIASTLTNTYTCLVDGVASTHATAADTTYPLGNPWIALNPATNAYYLQFPFEVK